MIPFGPKAKTSLCPGLGTMLFNLISSSEEEDPQLLLNQPEWIQEYTHGQGFEIYRVPLSPAFQGITFLQAAKIVYDVVGCVMFALEINPRGSDSRVILNPGDFLIPDCLGNVIYAFLIAEDRKQADMISPQSLSGVSAHMSRSIGDSWNSKDEKTGPKITPVLEHQGSRWIEKVSRGSAVALQRVQSASMSLRLTSEQEAILTAISICKIETAGKMTTSQRVNMWSTCSCSPFPSSSS